jgi:hypothetical protein
MCAILKETLERDNGEKSEGVVGYFTSDKHPSNPLVTRKFIAPNQRTRIRPVNQNIITGILARGILIPQTIIPLPSVLVAADVRRQTSARLKVKTNGLSAMLSSPPQRRAGVRKRKQIIINPLELLHPRVNPKSL